ncbi:hypothetical protein K491DRAFT_2913 [Lophiostoma macrostomum CBS 122681]|uniref:Uncharacterized protein n=1 Tax=Lophiostoma macrostomum CBS 122681 TaxID=1314788 RepID=A0A6A6TTN9_9PLEO|nr:hypothetical protein K491DRAFT_2913 [Lophiostoma macrostomum CBS 122681]
MASMANPPGNKVQPPIASTPLNPTSLLWGHQLKREHGFLLDRMKTLEKGHQGYDARIRSAEVAANTVKNTAQDIKRLERSLSAIDESDRHRSAWIESAEPRLAKMQEDIDKGKKVQPRVSALEGKHEDLHGEVQRLTSSQSLVTEKIATLERRLQDSGAQKLIKKNDMNDVRVLGQRLQTLEALRKEEKAVARAMQDKIGSLERNLQKYDSKNEQLRVRLEMALSSRHHPFPSSEVSTEHLYSSDPGFVQVPASPQFGVGVKR